MTARPLAPLPVPVRPRHGETAVSYVRRLARANHLNPSYLRSLVSRPSHGGIQADMLAAVSGRTARALEHTLAGLRQTRASGAPKIRRPPHKPPGEESPAADTIRRDAAARPLMPVRQLAALNQVSTRTVLQALTPPGSGEDAWTQYPAPLLAPLRPPIDAWLAEEPGIPAHKIWERLLDEHDAEIGYLSVNAYVTRHRARLIGKTISPAHAKNPIADPGLPVKKARAGQRDGPGRHVCRRTRAPPAVVEGGWLSTGLPRAWSTWETSSSSSAMRPSTRGGPFLRPA